MSQTDAYRMQIRTDSDDRNAIALFSNKQLVGILVELSDKAHGIERGRWVIEATFGMLGEPASQSFATASSAADWISDNICHQPFMLGKAAEAVPGRTSLN